MSVALRKADGDLYIDEETGRGEEVAGPTKVSQELFSLYSSHYDQARDWGIDLDFTGMTFSTPEHFRSVLLARVLDANDRIQRKQADDLFLDSDRELIRQFSQIEIIVDLSQSAGFFLVTANVGDPATEIGRSLAFSFKPVSSRHVVAPPFPDGLKFF